MPNCPIFEPSATPSNTTPFKKVAAERYSRRRVLGGGLAAAAGFLGLTAGVAPAAAARSAGRSAELNLVFVLDGLRPDSINPEDTPHMYRLRQQGVNFTRNHAVVPTVTRANGAALGTGMHPASNGMVANEMYVPELDPTSATNTANPNTLLELEEKTGAIVFTDTLAELLAKNDKKMVTIGSATPGGGPFLLNPTAQHGSAGVMINPADPAAGIPLAFPEEVGEEILDRFGPPPGGSSNEAVDYSTTVVTDYILTDLDPDVLFFWMIEPDFTQHKEAAGSPEAIDVIRNDDRNIGLVLDRLDELGLAETTNVFVTSDHGFTQNSFTVNVERELIDAGLKAAPDSDDVIVAVTGSTLINVKDRDPERIQAVTAFLQRQDWAAALYTAALRPADGTYRAPPENSDTAEIANGWVDGTFSLELIHQANPQRGGDILVAFPWNSRPNPFGIHGTSYRAGRGRTGPVTGPRSGHGGFSPWDVTNTLIAWGPDVKEGVTSQVPSGNVDIAPTILALSGVTGVSRDGRVLHEALSGGPRPKEVHTTTEVLTVRAKPATFASSIQFSAVGDHRYIDKSWRLPPG